MPTTETGRAPTTATICRSLLSSLFVPRATTLRLSLSVASLPGTLLSTAASVILEVWVSEHEAAEELVPVLLVSFSLLSSFAFVSIVF